MVQCSRAWDTELCLLALLNSVIGLQFVMIAGGSYLVCYLTGYWCCFSVPLVLYWFGNVWANFTSVLRILKFVVVLLLL